LAKHTLSTQKTKTDSINNISKNSFVVGIGSSAGGLEALKKFIEGLPKAILDASYIVAQHLSPQHKSMLVELLGKNENIEVVVAENLTVPQIGKMYITPPNSNIEIIDNKIKLSEPTEGVGPKPSVDKLFKSIAKNCHINGIGVILSGTGSDGALGIQAIRSEGGITISQEQESAKYDGMPQAAIDTDCVDAILEPLKIGEYLDKVIKTGKQRPVIETIAKSDLEQILTEVHAKTGISFHDYKETTLRRRLERRMVANGINSLPLYLKFIKQTEDEPQHLAQDFLISVTHFFRDKKAFETLAKLIKSKMDKTATIQNLRIWSVGCATGQEAYSIAILCAEALGGPEQLSRHNIQIFATDIDSNALSIARSGSYSASALEDMPADLRNKYFIGMGDKMSVVKPLKDIILFSKHNILENPPFSRVDLLTCRNVMIYFSAKLQEKAFKVFHYSLVKDGTLFLGKSESLGNAEGLFKKLPRPNNFYSKKNVRLGRSMGLKFDRGELFTSRDATKKENDANNDDESTITSLIEAIAPNSVIVNKNLDIEHIYGDVTPFVKFASGRPTMNLVTNIVQALRQEVKVYGYKVLREEKKGTTNHRPLEINGEIYDAWITFYPLNGNDSKRMLAHFETKKIDKKDSKLNSATGNDVNSTNVVMLEQELQATQEHLQTVIEELETLNEELQSTNEELQSSNEELHSTNEELETSNEELQSTNEEISTVNDELSQKKVDLEKSHYELINMQNSIKFPVLRLDDNLQIVDSNLAARELFHIETDSNVPLVRSMPDSIDVMPLVKCANDTIQGRDVKFLSLEHDGRNYWLQFHPFKNSDDKVTGVILTLVDETEQTRIKNKLFTSQARYNAIASSNVIPIFIKDLDGKYTSINEGCELLLKKSEKEIIGLTDREIHPDQPYEHFRKNDLVVQNTRKTIAFEEEYNVNGEMVTYLSVKAPMFDENGEVSGTSGVAIDISKQKRYAIELEKSNEAIQKANEVKSSFLANMSHEIRTPLNAICGIAEMLENFSLSQNKRAKMTHKLGLAANQLSGLINDILDFSSLEGVEFKLNKEPLSLEKMCSELNDINSVKAQNKNLSLNFTIDKSANSFYIGDELRLKQILLNIIDNGIKFTDEGGIDVKVSANDINNGDSDVLEFVIADTGTGIDKKYLSKIFEKFAQGNTEMSKKSKGTGLGLSICRSLVAKMNGEMEVSSELNKGTTFTVQIPLERCSESDLTDANETETLASDSLTLQHPILIVEDTETNIDVMCSYLDHIGVSWEVVRNGKDALEMVEINRYSLILLDLQMADMDGFEVTEKIRASADELIRSIPIVAVTGHAEKTIRDKCFQLGMQDFLIKPLKLKNLNKVLCGHYNKN